MQAQMIHRLLFILFWIFFEALSVLNGWGVVGYLLAPLALAALLAGLVAAITRYAEAVDDEGDSLHSGS